MTLISPSRPNPYTGSPLDRASHLRTDAEWVASALADPATRFVPVWRARSLFRPSGDGAPEAVFVPPIAVGDHPWAFLGNAGGVAHVAIDLSAAEDPLPLLPPGIAGEFIDLRSVGAGLSADHMAILAHARGLMHWRSRHRFCGLCGAACEPHSAGNVMVCTACKTHHFPRTDPAVIMLVTRGDQALLGHSARFPNSVMYSTLAGFVEPGESLEEAVAREVLEESGVRVGQVRYHSSQPWPFPGSIMLGFYADGLSEEIILDKDELVDARWFSKEQMRDPKEHGFALPRADSIARRLIEDWIAA
jgi:NAD+ diphosphatase